MNVVCLGVVCFVGECSEYVDFRRFMMAVFSGVFVVVVLLFLCGCAMSVASVQVSINAVVCTVFNFVLS